jgi:hypothetical protein
MLRRIAIALLVAVVVNACADNILKERPVKRVATTPTPRAGVSFSTSAKGASTVCAAYRRQLAALRSIRRFAQANPVLKQKELSLNAVIADACE